MSWNVVLGMRLMPRAGSEQIGNDTARPQSSCMALMWRAVHEALHALSFQSMERFDVQSGMPPLLTSMPG